MAEVDPPPGPDDMPKHGAIGGAFTFTFTPTSIGVSAKVVYLKGTESEKSIDVTDYDSW
ncbi:unnamed protein product [marine sediment metagenome]|uniref:Uncharacterized protein n=1 Tax=marine sediment metagenome TaxID=412755 RepID=X1DXZ2_9ZZZZ